MNYNYTSARKNQTYFYGERPKSIDPERKGTNYD